MTIQNFNCIHQFHSCPLLFFSLLFSSSLFLSQMQPTERLTHLRHWPWKKGSLILLSMSFSVLSSQNSIKKKFSHIEDEKMKKKNVFVQIQKTEIINLKLAIEVAIISLANDEFLLEFKIYCRFSRIKPE